MVRRRDRPGRRPGAGGVRGLPGAPGMLRRRRRRPRGLGRVGRGRPVRTAPAGGGVMTRQTGSPELHAALLAYLAEGRFPDPAPEPEALVQDTLPGMEAG